uniref:Ras-GEF domain-containing protein n=1 Tax=Equus asinus TaxID=9793 RepID=A0A9L0J7N7_EQUAS
APALLPGAEAAEEKGPHLELDGTPVLFLPSLLALEPAAAPSAAPDPERVPSAAPAQVPGSSCAGCSQWKNNESEGPVTPEVFKNVEPSECLGSTWGKRNRPGHENVAPTVWATVVQFNRVVKCVMTSCLGDPNVTARGQGQGSGAVWIEVARECRALRNISSLHAVLSALQSVPIHRLKKTWGKVAGYKGFEAVLRVGTLGWARRLSMRSFQGRVMGTPETRASSHLIPMAQGIVPFLGTMLTDLIMLDTAMEDYVNVSEEHKVMMEIVQLQEAAENYNLEPQERFRAWFWDMQQLSEDESYSLSCQLEPRC